MTATLRLVHSRADLPPKWDGEHVVWSEWHEMGSSSIAWHLPLDQQACTRCGLISGRELYAEGWIGSVIRLTVHRCECGHDVAVERNPRDAMGPVWDLELEDYGPDGSWPDTDGRLW